MNAVVRVIRSTVVDAPIEAIWRLLRDFNSHKSWHPAIAASRIEAGEPADTVGAVRVFRLADGSVLREQLIALSDRNHELTYCLTETSIPLMDYVATMRLRPVTEGDRTFIVWESRFRPPEAQVDALARLVGETIYEAGFAALKMRFESPGAAMTRAEPAPRPTLLPTIEGSSLRVTAPGAFDVRAVIIERYGGPEVMAIGRLSVPPPGPGEVRIRHKAIGVNFIDVYCRSGFFRLLTPPGVPGMEAAGEVIDIGPDIRHLHPGDRVVYACPPVGAYAEARTMDAALVVPLPADIDDESAAAVFLKGLSAEYLLHRVHRIVAGETVLIHAAAGGTGLLLCQWAHALGAHVIGTVGSDSKVEAALGAGAVHVIVYSRTDFVSEVMNLTGGCGADVIYDGVGASTFERSLDALAVRGHLVSTGQASGPVGSHDIGAMASKSMTVSRPNYGHYTSDPVELRAMADRLFDALRRRIVVPTIDRRLPLAEAAEAHRRLESRDSVGAIVLLP